MPLVSVIVPVYNASRYLDSCINSILNQTLTDIEIIFVNDGSTDNSLEILNSYAEKDVRITILSQENISAGVARNKGLAIAKGEYLSFLDADDFFESEMLSEAYNRAKKVDADVIAFRCDRYDDKRKDFTETTWTIRDENFPKKEVFSYKDINNIFNCFSSWAWDKLFKAQFVRNNNLLFQNQKSINDLYFVHSALARAERISIIDKILAHKRHNNDDSITTKYLKTSQWHCYHDALLALKMQLENWKLYEELGQDYVNYALIYTLWHLRRFQNMDEYSVLYDLVKNQWLCELDVLNHEKEYFYDRTQYMKLNKLLEQDSKTYREEEILKESDDTFLFPFELVEKGTKIVIYGAGRVGKSFYRQVKYTDYCEILAWVDKKVDEKSSLLKKVDVLSYLKFDYIVIAINNEKTVNAIKNHLNAFGVDENKLIWRAPEITLQEL